MNRDKHTWEGWTVSDFIGYGNRPKTIKLTESDAIFVHYALRVYAQQTPGLHAEDKAEIKEVAAKFK